MPNPKKMPIPLGRDLFALFVFVALCFLVAAAGGAVTASSVDTWFQQLQKPSFNPPDWIFAPVWTLLYLLMAIASWLVWRTPETRSRRLALFVFGVQLLFNFAWSFLFFGQQRVDLALINIITLLLLIITNGILFWHIERRAGLLFIPYILWVAFASVLNASIWMLN